MRAIKSRDDDRIVCPQRLENNTKRKLLLGNDGSALEDVKIVKAEQPFLVTPDTELLDSFGYKTDRKTAPRLCHVCRYYGMFLSCFKIKKTSKIPVRGCAPMPHVVDLI